MLKLARSIKAWGGRVLARVYEDLEAVGATGANMFDFERVAALAQELGYHETAQWVRDFENADALVMGIINAFEPLSRADL